MAQHGLHRVDIRPAAYQMGGKGVAQSMGRNILVYSRLLPVMLDNLPKALTAHSPAAAVGKKPFRLLAFQKLPPGLLQI